jgi:lysophospholipase L1-like esterase
MRICFFGDSFVNGTGDDDGLGWVGRLVARARQSGRDVTGYNLGIRRDTSADVAARWKAEATLRLPPEYDGRLVFSFGANDCASDGSKDGPRISQAESVLYAERILVEAHSWRPTLMVGPGVVSDHAEANARICALSTLYAALCDRIGVPYLEICRALLASATWSREARAGDGAHPNRGGYVLLADMVSDWSSWRSWIEDRR